MTMNKIITILCSTLLISCTSVQKKVEQDNRIKTETTVNKYGSSPELVGNFIKEKAF